MVFSVYLQGDKNTSQESIKKYVQKRKNTQPLEYASMISDKHANFIINLGGAKAEDIVKLIKLVKEAVKDKFEINLKEEINYLGF